MQISVTAPLDQAMKRMMKVCFQPFNIEKWFGLGFCAFLAGLLDGGGGNFQVPGNLGDIPGTGNGDYEEMFAPAAGGMFGLGQTELVIIAAVIVLVLVLYLVAAWLSGRGRFMLIDGVVHDRGDVKAPWREFESEGNSLFAVRLLFTGLFLALLGAILAIAFLVVWPGMFEQIGNNEELGPLLARSFSVLGVIVFFGLIWAVIDAVIVNLVAPIMYVRHCSFVEAWGACRDTILANELGAVALFILMRIVLAIGSGLLTVVVVLLTCCIALLPYIGTVILLPMFVFLQAYSLYFVDQFGEGFAMFSGHGTSNGTPTPTEPSDGDAPPLLRDA